MKKNYITPRIRVAALQNCDIICVSDPKVLPSDENGNAVSGGAGENGNGGDGMAKQQNLWSDQW